MSMMREKKKLNGQDGMLGHVRTIKRSVGAVVNVRRLSICSLIGKYLILTWTHHLSENSTLAGLTVIALMNGSPPSCSRHR